MKAKRYIAVAAAALTALVACQREEGPDAGYGKEGDLAEAVFSVVFPEPLPSTRATMSEGPTEDEFNIHLCLFGPGEGYVQNWIPATRLSTTTDASGHITGGTYKVMLPLADDERTVHIIANPPAEATPTASDYLDNVMEKMVDSDKECSYWQQVKLSSIKGTMTGGVLTVVPESVEPLNGVHLVRNFAKLVVSSTPDENFSVKRWTVINVPDKGYVAPYTGDRSTFPKGYLNIKDYSTGTALYTQLTDVDEYKGYMPTDAVIDGSFPGDPSASADAYANGGEALYLYERPLPSSDAPQTAILVEVEFETGHLVAGDSEEPVTYWYKIEVLDDKGAYVPFLRNIVYRLNIQGLESAGSDTAEEAFNEAYFGNISASLETASLSELSNGTSLIHVDLMDYTFMTGDSEETLMNGDAAAQFYFVPDLAIGDKYTKTTSGVCEIKVTQESVSGYDQAVTAFSANDDGSIKVTLASTGTKVKKSVIRVSGKAEGGKEIYRDITINLMETQSFSHNGEETSITNDPVVTGAGNPVEITIHLPEDLGASVFPIQVRIEAKNNSLSATTSDLPVTTGKSVFDPSRNTYFYIRTIKYSEYCALNTKTKKYEYNYDFTCTFYTSKSGDNSTLIDIRDLAGNFNPTELTLGTPGS